MSDAQPIPRSTELNHALMDMLHLAVVVIGEHCEIRRCNASAARLLDTADGLWATGNHLEGTGPVLATLMACLRRALPGEVIAGLLDRPSGRMSYQLLVAHLANDETLLVLSDPVDTLTGIGQTLKEIYRLTESEAAIAECISQGMDLSQIADYRGVTRETVRRQLRTVFDKTGARRQVDLVRLIAGGTAVLQPTRREEFAVA